MPASPTVCLLCRCLLYWAAVRGADGRELGEEASLKLLSSFERPADGGVFSRTMMVVVAADAGATAVVVKCWCQVPIPAAVQ